MNTDFLNSCISDRSTRYVYDLDGIGALTERIIAFHSPFFQTRYAMKANSNPHIMQVIREAGIGIDCCSEFEIPKAIENGFKYDQIQLSSQQSPKRWDIYYEQGVSCIATSLHQLKLFGMSCSGGNVGVRINPGKGSGQFGKVNTGGVQSSFGIRHEYYEQIHEIAKTYALHIDKLHIHIGSGADTKERLDVLLFCLDQVFLFPEVTVLNMGGGYKVGRMQGEQHSDLPAIIEQAITIVSDWSVMHGRKLSLEIEPGTYFVANFGYIFCTADDVVDTGPAGFRFVRTTTGMDMILRPTMYGAQHPIFHFSEHHQKRSDVGDNEYVFVGHCCESSDLLTPQKNNPEGLSTRGFDQEIIPGDVIVLGGAGAYCESMRCVGYNGFKAT